MHGFRPQSFHQFVLADTAAFSTVSLGLEPALRDRKTGKEDGEIHGEVSSSWTKLTAIDELEYMR